MDQYFQWSVVVGLGPTWNSCFEVYKAVLSFLAAPTRHSGLQKPLLLPSPRYLYSKLCDFSKLKKKWLYIWLNFLHFSIMNVVY